MRFLPIAAAPLAAALVLPCPIIASAQVGSAASETQFDVSLVAQPLGSALAALARQTRTTLSVAPALLVGRSAPAVSGRLSVRLAYERVLGASGMVLSLDGSVVTITEAGAPTSVLPPVTVTGVADKEALSKPYAGGQIATGAGLGLLGDRGVMETPFNVTSYTSTLIRNQQAASVAEVLANDPSVSNLKASGNDYDGYNIRGFLVNNTDIAFAGLYGIAPAQRTFVEGLERIEVIKGPNALLTGINPGGSVGGSINLVPKRANDDPLTEITLRATSGTVLGTHLDVGRRFGEDHQFGVRFNGAFDDGHTDLANQRERVTNTMLALDFRGDRVRAFLDVGVQNYNITSPKQHVQLLSGLNVPNPPSANANYTQPWTRVKTTETYGAGRVEFDIDKGTTAYATIGAKHFEQDTNANFRYRFTDGNGGLTVIPFVGRGLYAEQNVSGEAGIRGSFQAGSIKNRWSIGTSIYHSNQFYGTVPFVGSIPNSTIYDPVFIADPGAALPTAPRTNSQQNTSLAVSDTLSVMQDRLQLTIGARNQTVGNASYDDTTGELTSAYSKSAVTPSVGVLFKVRDDLSVYANYIQGLSAGEIVDTSYSNGGQILPPYKTKQYEAGIKFDMGALLATASVFQIQQPSSKVDVATNTFLHNGQQRNRGVEVSLYGEPIPGIRFNGGAMLLDPKLIKTDGGAGEGNNAPGQPRFKANLSGEWDVPSLRGLTVLGSVSYSGGQYVDNDNTQSLPSWTVYGVGVRYATELMGRPLALRGKIDNLFARAYWQNTAFGLLNPGGPRSVIVSASMSF